ncbi:unnamed protein product [Cylindrotheca closterium]|uniref:Uncharacterized protein n=1 Tax=Cylindrotheca closterium TaxID=2856 RepID=A0AAD2CH97_9STRA|nr:unnamed protein product [Cylindrotheca closterium]
MHRTASSESFSSVGNEKKDFGNPPRRATRRSSIGDRAWPPQPKGTDMSSSSHDNSKPKQKPQHMLTGFITPGARSGGKQKLKVTAPMSANPRLNTLLSPKTPGHHSRRRASAKLKMLWPALDETEYSKTAAISPVSRRVSSPVPRRVLSPFQSPPTIREPTQKRMSESPARDLGTPLLSATGKRRTLKGVWPPPNMKQDTDKKNSVNTPKLGITKNRKSMFNRSSTFGSADGDTEKRNQTLSPLKPISAHTAVSASTTSSSNDDWASVSDFNDRISESATSTPTQQPSSVSSKKVDPDSMNMSLVLVSESSEHDAGSSYHSGIHSITGNGKSYIHSWDLWTEQENESDDGGDSPLVTPTRDAIPLETKTDFPTIPKAPDLVMSPPNDIPGPQSSTPNTTDSGRQKLHLPSEGIASVATSIENNEPVTKDAELLNPKNDSAIKPTIGRPPTEFSSEETNNLAKMDAKSPAQKSQTRPSLLPPEESSTQLKEGAAPADNDNLSTPSPQHCSDENLQSSDDESVWSSEDGDRSVDEASVEDKYDQASDGSPTSPTTDSIGSLSPTEIDEEELGPPRFIVPLEQKPLPPKTRVIRKTSRTEYRIRWDGPTTLDLGACYPLVSIPEVDDLPEQDDRFKKSQTDGGIAMPMRSGRSIDGDSMSIDSILSGDGTIDSDDKSESSSHSRPSIHMRHAEGDEKEDEDSKWKLKRVWNREEMDGQEKEHTVQRKEVMPSVKELCGVPANIDLNDMDNGKPWVIQRVNFIDDTEIDCEDEEVFTADGMLKEMEMITSRIDFIREKQKAPAGDPNTSKDKTTDAEKAEEKAETIELNPAEKKLECPIDKKRVLDVMANSKDTSAVTATAKEARDSTRESLQPLPRLILPNGQKLPSAKRKKGRRTNYQLRYDGPSMLRVTELFSIPEEDRRFNETKVVDKSMMPRPVRRGSGRKSAFGTSGEHDAMPEKPSRSRSNDDLDFMLEDGASAGDDLKGSSHGDDEGAGSVKRPQLLMTPNNGRPQSFKWLVRRVWDDDEFDEKEDEYSVADKELTSKVRELFGVPDDVDLENMKSESRFKDISSECDSAPFLLRRIYDFDGEIEEVEAGVAFSTADLKKTIECVSAEAKETVMWWDLVPDSEPKYKPLGTKLFRKAKEPWYSYNAKDESKPKKVSRILPWHKKATPKKVEEQGDVKMWWEE